jgi:hypothetical protein
MTMFTNCTFASSCWLVESGFPQFGQTALLSRGRVMLTVCPQLLQVILALRAIPNYSSRKGQIIGTHTLEIRCVCTDENATCDARNLLKTMDTEGSYRACVISTTTLSFVSSRTHPHTHTEVDG